MRPLKLVSVIAVLALAGCSANEATGATTQDSPTQSSEASWHSPSLTMETVTNPTNGSVTTQTQLEANGLWGLTEQTVAEKVTDGVYALRGPGLASSYAIDAPDGWIIVDTGDSTRAAQEMRDKLEEAVGKKITVAAILLTHWHYADGTAAWMDKDTVIWGHEDLDRIRRATSGVSVKTGVLNERTIAQFGMFHPDEGADSFPSLMRLFPEKLLSESSYEPPMEFFKDGKVQEFTIAGEPVQVAPSRTDSSDSVAFYFPKRSLVVTNMVVTGAFFNIYTLRGDAYRDPAIFLKDARWVESRNAKYAVDVHGPTVKGRRAVKEAIERSVDQVQVVYDQTLRLMAQGLTPREAAEAIYVPGSLRDGREAYGQVESFVRQIYSGTLGWFDGDVYEINPLAVDEEATRTIEMMGGVDAVRKAAAQANEEGGLDNWRWSLKLTSLLLRVDPDDAQARQIRADASRAIGQRTTSANARGFYINEALELEGNLKIQGMPVTSDQIRKFAGTPTADQLEAASVEENLQFVRYMVDSRKAEGKQISFTLSVEGEPGTYHLDLRNSVLRISTTDQKSDAHVTLTRRELADFVLGTAVPAQGGEALTELNSVLDRTQLLVLAPQADAGLSVGQEIQEP